MSESGVRLLGPVEIWSAGRTVWLPRRQQRLVLAVLALAANHMVPVDRLVRFCWPDTPPRGGRQQIQVLICRLRAHLAQAGVSEDELTVVTAGSSYALRTDPARIDVHEFRGLVEQARRAADDEEKVALLGRALALWRGPALDGAASEQVRTALCTGLEAVRQSAIEDQIEALLRLGRHREVLGSLADQVAAEPLREGLVALLMLALYRTGRAAEALETYRHTRRRLADELGLDPGPQLQRLHQNILRADPALDLPSADPSPQVHRLRQGRPGDLQAEAMIMTGLGRLRFTQDRFAEAATAYNQALDGFRTIGDRAGQAAALSGLGTVYAEGGRFDDAEPCLDRAIDLFDQFGDLSGYAHAVYMLGFTQRERGADDAALASLQGALAAYQTLEDRRGQALLQRSVGLVHRAREEYPQAQQRFQLAREIFTDLDDPHGLAYVDQARAKVGIRRGDCAEAGRTLRQGLRLCVRRRDRFGTALMLRTIGELKVTEGDAEAAHSALDESLVLWDQLQLRLWHARTLLTVADLQAKVGNRSAARSARKESGEIFLEAGSREAIIR